MKFLGLEVGSWADWFGAIGTILAVVVSVWITRYQITADKKATKENFFNEQEFIMLNYVSEDIIKMHSAILSISRIVNEGHVDLSDENNGINKEIKTNITKIEEFIFQINTRLYEYGRTREGYTDINMTGMRNLFKSWSSVSADLDKITKNNSINIDDVNKKAENFIQDIGFMEEAIIQKKKDIRH